MKIINEKSEKKRKLSTEDGKVVKKVTDNERNIKDSNSTSINFLLQFLSKSHNPKPR